ncbi:MAG TPA: MoaD/ThiS family protein, partial [Acidimicrobiales bacterium]|nr:MoaD/ThiS family protein [Acidimicrobiales bacterium]
MPVLRLFASAREAAGVARAELEGATVDELLAAASALYGERFQAVLARSRVWVNGEPATGETPVTGHDVVAVLPPVSGGAGEAAVLERPAEPDAAPAPAAPEAEGPAEPETSAAPEPETATAAEPDTSAAESPAAVPPVPAPPAPPEP